MRIIGARPQDVAGYDKGRVIYSFRRKGERDWQPLSIVDDDARTSTGFDPHAVDPPLDERKEAYPEGQPRFRKPVAGESRSCLRHSYTCTP